MIKTVRSSSLFAIAIAGLQLIASDPVRAQTPVTVTFDTKNPEATIAPDFIGLSYEISMVLPADNGKYFFNPENQKLVEMFHTLGVKCLRVGGNTADRDTVKIPNTTDIDSLFAFAKAADVKVIYTLRMDGAKPAADANIAKYIMDHYRAELMCFTIGNEPNHYFTNYPPYNEAWKKFAGVITGPDGAPNAVFCGPSFTPKGVDWAAEFAQDHPHDPRIAFITQHEYPAGSGRTATNILKAREKLLSPDLIKNYEKFHDRFVPAVKTGGFGYRLEECNNFSNGGAVGTSDAFAAALWGLDYMYWWAEHGALGLNFHTSGYAPGSTPHKPMNYAAFNNTDDGYFARPLSYAMKAFEIGGKGRMVEAKLSTDAKAINLRAYGVSANDHSFFVTLINKEHGMNAREALVAINVDSSFAHAQVMALSAPNGDVGAKRSVTLGGAAISEDGTWHGEWTENSQPPANGKFSVKVPAATAVVVKLN